MKKYIAILKDEYFGYVVMIADKKPWVQLDNGDWFFQAQSFTIRYIEQYRAFLNSFKLGKLAE